MYVQADPDTHVKLKKKKILKMFQTLLSTTQHTNRYVNALSSIIKETGGLAGNPGPSHQPKLPGKKNSPSIMCDGQFVCYS